MSKSFDLYHYGRRVLPGILHATMTMARLKQEDHSRSHKYAVSALCAGDVASAIEWQEIGREDHAAVRARLDQFITY